MIKHQVISLFLVVVFAGAAQYAFGQPDQKYIDQWNDPAIKERIDNGIKQNRQGQFVLEFQNSKGEPLKNISVEIQQTGHDFYFGANGFMVKGFQNSAEDELFEKHFTRLFNFVTIPFYWPELEPQPGRLRFDRNSEYIYRRPAPDLVLDFCKKYHLTTKGHTLVWDNPRWSLPPWLPRDEAIMEKAISKRIGEIGERYGHDIQIWDVVNEVTDRHPDVIMPRDFAYKAFKESGRLFPGSNCFTLNYTTGIWRRSDKREYSPDYLLTENLLLRGAKVDAIGMQYHNFDETEYWNILKGEVFTPVSLFSTLDLYADFGLPIHITEITVSALSEKGPEYQAIMTENLYRLWFSHPKVEAIIWWNLVDGTAAPGYARSDGTTRVGEDKWKGGLLNRDFTKKPAYEVLDRLINKEWKTNMVLTSNDEQMKFSGFYGTYSLKISKDGKNFQKTVTFSKKGSRIQTVILD